MTTTQDLKTERAFYDDLFAKNPDNEHITAGYDEIHDSAFTTPPDGLVLDLGCGTGGHSIRMARRGFSVVGIDISLFGAKAARERLRREGYAGNFLVADAQRLPLKDKAVSVTWGGLLLHHFPTLETLAGEIARVTRDRFIALEPNAHNLLTGFAINVVHRFRPIKAMTPNQRALVPGEVRRTFGPHGFGDFQVRYFDRGWGDGWQVIRRSYRLATSWLPKRFSSNKFLIQCRVNGGR